MTQNERTLAAVAASIAALVVLFVWPWHLLLGLPVAAVVWFVVFTMSRPNSRRETTFHD